MIIEISINTRPIIRNEANIVCYYVGTDAIIANYLIGQNKETVTSTEIISYCKDVYKYLHSKDKSNYAYFDVTFESIKNTMDSNDDLFEMYYDKIYLKKYFDINTINNHLNDTLKDALVSVAKMQVAF